MSMRDSTVYYSFQLRVRNEKIDHRKVSLLFPAWNTGVLMNRYAYIRVSTKEQNIDRQLHALESFDIPKKMFIAIINQERILKDHSIRN